MEVDPHLITDALARLFPVSPPPPLPTMQLPQPPESITADSGRAAPASTPATGKKKVVEKSCAWCGNKFMGQAGQLYHSSGCSAKAKAARVAEKAAKNGQQVET